MKKEKYRVVIDAPATIVVATLCVVIFVVDTLTAGWLNDTLCSVYYTKSWSLLGVLRLFLHIFGHKDLEHLIGNLTLFLVVGPAVEHQFGTSAYVRNIFLTAFLVGVAHFFLFRQYGLLGLSSIVFMLVVLSAYGTDNNKKEIPLSAICVILLWIGKELFKGAFAVDDTSQFAHIIGGWCGFIIGMFNAKLHAESRNNRD